MRFTAAMDGAYNEHIYTFFKCLSEERLRYAESWAGPTTEATSTVIRAHRHRADEDEWCRIDGWRVPRRCPHLQGDLSRFGSIVDDVLTCKLHGWQFDLETGRCLTTGEPGIIKADRI
jgi:UDP-MurNAc hydroxylase